ncbi:Sialin [Aphelenchoides bicaudatus]|nr:Sialin [Aphelenchoides bicaudatus]
MNTIGANEPPPSLNVSSSMKRIVDCDGGSSASYASSESYDDLKFKSRIFPSTRFFMALLLCLCFISLAITTSNISLALVCMVTKQPNLDMSKWNHTFTEQQAIQRLKRAIINESEWDHVRQALFENELFGHEENVSGSSNHLSKCALMKFQKRAVEIARQYGQRNAEEDELELERLSTVTSEKCGAEGLDWSSTERGFILAAQNAGSLLMLATGTQADRLNSKWMIVVSLSLIVVSNIAIPLVSSVSVWLTVAARVLTGFADALLQPSTSSMITRWFPPKERTFAIGLVTGGRQIGTLLILPLSGVLCDHKELMGGWPSIFYFSALVGSCILVAWLLMAADKPSKQPCIRDCERRYIEKKIEEENLGKRKHRKAIPWKQIRQSVPLYAGVAALVCHEYPLVIMLQLLPMYLKQILNLDPIQNGIISALPIGVLFLSKTMSSSLSSYIGSRKEGFFVIGRTRLVKIFNAIASLGLAVCTIIVPFFNKPDQLGYAITALCLSAAFAGLHTPGVQTALLQLAPAYTGIVTGIAFGVVAVFGIINKVFSTYIASDGTLNEWRIVFGTSAAIALLPVFFFTLWGSADRQPWATIHSSQTMSTATIEGIAKDKKIANIVATRANSTAQDNEQDQSDGEEEEKVASALRLRMFLSQDSTEEDEISNGTSVTDEEGGKRKPNEQRF